MVVGAGSVAPLSPTEVVEAIPLVVSPYYGRTVDIHPTEWPCQSPGGGSPTSFVLRDRVGDAEGSGCALLVESDHLGLGFGLCRELWKGYWEVFLVF